ncbi:MAG: DUF4868 domain-containing protein [Oscillospiraceae bacterium]|jgi:hypothetical protein|nr:DUF4868 domain-containing protein [Oscillospiraceae bacterium]
MDTQSLTEGLRSLVPSGLEWKFALYTVTKKRGEASLEWYSCDMADIAGWVGTVRDALLNKPVAEKPVAPYSPFLSDRENIAVLAASDELICQQLTRICGDIRNAPRRAAEYLASGGAPKPTGYVFYSDGESMKPVLLLRRVSPFLKGPSRLCVAAGDGVRVTDKPIIRLAPAVDFLLLDGACYFFSSGVEKDFEFENRHFAIASKRLALIADAGVISNIEALERVAFTPKNARKFVDFDKQVLEHIARLPITEREDFLVTYGVMIDHDGRMDTSDSEQCELIIDLLCSRSCLDPLGRLAVGSNITIR